MTKKNFKKNNGFSLAELSIVIVIIALIIGATVGAKAVLETSKLRRTYTDLGQIVNALNTFKFQYEAYPGDIKDFSSFYSECVDNSETLCNGNGDGKIDSVMSSSTYKENLRVYQHLSFAGLYPGSYDALGTGITNYGVGANNTPLSPLNGGNKLIYSFWRWSSGGYIITASALMLIARSRLTADSNRYKPYDGGLTAKQALFLDTKIDDGKADSGSIIFRTSADSVHECASGSLYAIEYADELNCGLYYVIKN